MRSSDWSSDVCSSDLFPSGAFLIGRLGELPPNKFLQFAQARLDEEYAVGGCDFKRFAGRVEHELCALARGKLGNVHIEVGGHAPGKAAARQKIIPVYRLQCRMAGTPSSGSPRRSRGDETTSSAARAGQTGVMPVTTRGQ